MKKATNMFYNIAVSLVLLFTTLSGANAFTYSADIGVKKVEEAIKEALTEQGVEGKLDINVSGYSTGFDLLHNADSYTVHVKTMNVNDRNRLWNATVAFIPKNQKSEIFRVSGKYDVLVNVPVLTKKLPQHTVIAEEDIDWIEMPSRNIRFGTVMDAEKLIGQELRRSMRDRTPIKDRDIQKEQILSRNNNVNILYRSGTISLRTIGIALDSGGIGDVIKVRNPSSNKIIQAIIIDGENVEAMASANANYTPVNHYTIEQASQAGGNYYVR